MSRFPSILRPILFFLAVGAITLDVQADREKEITKKNAKFALVTPDGKTIVLANKNVQLFDPVEKTKTPISNNPARVVLSPDGGLIAIVESGGPKDAVRVLDLTTKKQKSSFVVPGNGIASAVTADGKYYAHATAKDILVFDAAGKQKATTKKTPAPFTCLAVSIDGKYLASGTDMTGKTVDVWETATLKKTQTFEMPDKVRAVVFSPDGKTLAASAADTVRTWDYTSGQVTSTLIGTKDKIVRALAYADRGKLLLGGTSDGLVIFWDVDTGRPRDKVQTLKDVFGISVSADGKLLATVLEGDEVKIYDTAGSVGAN